MNPDDRVDRLAEILVRYGAEVIRATPDSLSERIVGLIAERGWHRLVSVRRNRVGHPSVMGDDPLLEDEDLSSLDAVITESALAVADSGLIVLDHGPGQGRPSLTSIPRLHVCVVEEDSIVDSIDDAEERIDSSGPVSWISGRRAPEDLVDGLHKTDSLIVVLVGREE